MSLPPRLPWRGPPLALQITALLLGGLVVAQLVTLFLTLTFPPAPAAQYGLRDIAAALSDQRGDDHHGLNRIVQAGPPDVSGPGWLVSEKSRRELARLMNVDDSRVSLAFYTPLPFAGTAAARSYAMANDGMMPTLASMPDPRQPSSYIVLAQFTPGQAGPMAQMAEGRTPPSRDAFPPGMFPGSETGSPDKMMMPGARIWRNGAMQALRERARGGEPLISVDPRFAGRPEGIFVPGDGGAAVPSLLRGRAVGTQVPVTSGTATTPAGTTAPAGGAATAPATSTTAPSFSPGSTAVRPINPPGGPLGTIPRSFLPDRSVMPPIAAPLSLAPIRSAPPLLMPDPQMLTQTQTPTPQRAAPVEAPARIMPVMPEPQGQIGNTIAPAPLMLAPRAQPLPETITPPSGPPIAISSPSRGLFGLAPAPFVEGDFVAALQMPNGRWSVVQPAPEPFPNSWQRRVLLWFVISLSLVAPVGWLFARRLVKPIDRFARAAEQLGRDPSSAIGPLDGPAEIGRAAHAFNLMQGRLRAFVDDRTAMVGAISHDLRTPLTRMRFRIEDVPDDVRDGLLEEVDEMEAMIAQVIDYIRDASTPGARERLDLGTLVEEAVEDARLVGGQVVIEHSDPAPVEIDVLGVRRVLDNLLENAIKYGDRARIRLRTESGSAIAEIFDEGPGLPDDEIERAFEPFYRSEAARASEKSGSGLGLAVCRSIARAHGGDVRLIQSGEGFLAEMRMPLAYDAERPLAA
jgi:two-component system OmpR family sensor kinase